MSVLVYSLFAQIEGEKKAFFGGWKKGAASWEYPQERLVFIKDEKSLSIFKIWNNSTPPLLFIRCPYKYGQQGMHFYDNFVDRFQDLSKEPCCHQGGGLIIN